MLSRSALGRTAPRALRQSCSAAGASGRRGLASAAPSLQYETSDAAGVKVANREVGGPTTTLALVAKAGPRYQPFPGFSEALEQFAFKSTAKRSALRITRETELLGSEISTRHSRENVILQAKFLSGDLPYFAELLAEVASSTKYAQHELQELVLNVIKYRQQALVANPEAVALDAAHGVAFHRGLGEPITPSTSTPFEQYLSTDALIEFAKGAYSKPNIALVSTGPNSAELSKWVGQFFADLPTTAGSSQFKLLDKTPSKYSGGEQRIASKAGSALVIAFPGSSAFGASGYKAETSVLAALLGGESSIKWSPGFSLLAKATGDLSNVHVSTKNIAYSDAGLFTITISGKASEIGTASKNIAQVLKKVAAGDVPSEDFNKAVALAKFRALEASQSLETGVEQTGSNLINGGKPYQIGEVAQSYAKVTAKQVQELAKSYISGKASVAAVGDLFHIPYAEDLGLTV